MKNSPLFSGRVASTPSSGAAITRSRGFHLIPAGALVACFLLPIPLLAQIVTSGGAANGSNAAVANAPSELNNIAETSALDVFLKTPDGSHVNNATVYMMLVNGQIYRQQTAEKDFAGFTNVPPTEYIILVSAPGYRQAKNTVDTSGRVTTHKLVVELQPLSVTEVAFANRLASLTPKAQQQLGKAMDALRANDSAKALRSLDTLQHIAPNHSEVNYLLGVYASRMHDQDHAKSFWTRTLEVDPNHFDSLLSLSQIYLNEKKSDDALALARRAAEVDPSSWRPDAVLASAFVQKLDYPHALQHAQRSVQLGHAQAAIVQPMLADLLAYTGDKPHAIETLKSYIADHPSDADAKKELERIETAAVPAAPAAPSAAGLALADAASAAIPDSNWIPPDVDAWIPPVEPGATCDLAAVQQGAGDRIKELVRDVDRYTATESLFHQSINKWGVPDNTQSVKFDYLVSIKELRPGIFDVDEYRRSNGNAAQFPDNVASLGLPFLAMIFHPNYAPNFDMDCEGLTQSNGVPAWQIHFRQRSDRPNTLRSYQQGAQGSSYPVAMKGRAWLAADTFQLLRLETDLLAPMPTVQLFSDHTVVEYSAVRFRDSPTELWLPRSAEVFFHWKNLRVHRRHVFDNYLLFSTDATQKITVPSVPNPAPSPQ